MLSPHPFANLEYWFFKFNDQDVALLVDWICRRRLGTGEVRISIHSPYGREVLFVSHNETLVNGPREFTLGSTTWSSGKVQWDLTQRLSEGFIRPQIFPAEQLRIFDLSVVSAPTVLFNGWIQHHSDRYAVTEAKGMISHYWGRQLPQEWWWISANNFDSDISLECSLLLSHVWGSSILFPIGYLYIRHETSTRLIIAPPGRISVKGSPDSFVLSAKPMFGPKIVLEAVGRDYNSLREGIINTLIGDLKVWEDDKLLGYAQGTAGLERRRV